MPQRRRKAEMLDKKHDSSLLKELKSAYEYYIIGDVESFDATLARLVLSFGADAKRIVERVDDELSGREKRNY
jgi:hypothetical protein